ncbi:MAG: DUF835 domain-containing protein [Thermoplasmata archaeon]
MNICDRFPPQNSEKDMIEFWESIDVDDLVSESRRGGKNLFVPHIPVKTKDCLNWNDIYMNMIYDTFSRFKSIRNFNVRSGIGYDPLNNVTERAAFKAQDTPSSLKTLDAEGKEEFLDLAEEKSEEFLESTRESLRYLGLWMVEEFDYRTDDDDFVDSIWWSISELMDEGLLFRKKIPLKWCPSCKISPAMTERSTEVENRDEAMLKISLKSGKKRYFLTYVDEPWKFPSSLNIAVHPDQKYAVVKSKRNNGEIEQWVVLKDNVYEILETTDAESYKIQKVIDGKDLEGLSYIYPLREYIADKTEKHGKIGSVVLSNEVPLDTTGIVPFVPSYDENHWEIAEEKELATYDPLMPNGHFDNGPRKNKYSGLNAFESEQIILDDLESEGILMSKVESQKDVQRCDTCKTRLIKFPKSEWFFNGKHIEEDYAEDIEEINFLPRDKDLRFKEWQVTRDDLWGYPFPVWECDCDMTFVPSDLSELDDYSDRDVNGPVYPSMLSDMEVECPECEEEMTWVGKTIMPSFIRSCSPWAQLGYPSEEKGYQSWWPGEIFIGDNEKDSSLVDENLALSFLLFGESSTENMMALGDVVSEVDYDNVEGLVNKHGYDSLRVHLYSDHPPWARRKITSTDLKYMHPLLRVLKNLQKYFEKYLESSEFDLKEIKEGSLDDDILPEEEEWIHSRLETLRRELEKIYPTCRFDKAINTLNGFVIDDFAQTYFILAKKRLEEGTREKQLAILRLFYKILDTISKLILPVAPFLSEDIYQGIKGEKESVFLEDWPEELDGPYDPSAEEDMDRIKNIIDEIFQTKRRSELPEKWPLQKIIYKAKNQEAIELIERFEEIVKEKAKVKEIQILYPDEEWEDVIIRAEPKRDVIRKSYQHWVSKIATMLKKKSPEKIKEGMEKGSFEMGLEGQIIEIDPSMVKFTREMPESFENISFDSQDIYVDLRVSEDIWDEEMVREIKLRIRSMCDDLDLEKGDEIDVSIRGDEDVQGAVENYWENIRKETGIRELILRDEEIYDREYVLEWDVNGQIVEIGLDPLFKSEVVDYISGLSGLDEEEAQIFYEAGFSSVESLREATVDDLSEIEDADDEIAEKIVSSFEQEGEEEAEEKEEVTPEEGEEMPEEEEKEKPLPDEFSRSSTYLIKERDSDRSFEIFNQILGTIENGLCVTRDYPDKIRKEYDLEGVDMIWLSNVDREDVIRPKSLEKLSLALENFLTKTGGVILFNGVEYLITNNDFRTVLHLIQSIKDQVAINDSIMIIPVNPDILERSQLDQVNGVVDETIESESED